MKTTLLLALCLLFSGCAMLRQPVIPHPVVSERITIQPAQTNVVVQGTNVITTILPETATTNYVTNIVYAVNPALQNALETGRRINSALNPTPTAPLVDLGLGTLAVLLGVWARFKTRQAAKERNMLNTVISGVEAVNSPEVKAKIEEFSSLMKTKSDLHKRVQETTR